MKFLIVIPTLNENKNITIIYKKIINIYPKARILFIDDNSTDGSKDEIININKKNKNINFIFRSHKLGIGSAHKIGINYAKKKGYDFICTMDCDGTHNPRTIKTMFKYSKKYDLVITSRFKKKEALKDWPFKRILITKLRYILVYFLLGTKLDGSGGFRLYDLKSIKVKDIFRAKDDNYNFFWESTYILERKYKIYEVPITLPNRTLGLSKMRFKDIIFGIIYLIKIFIKYRIFNSSK